MGQEAGKAAWPKPSGGYQTITGRRYGRRHAYISFRPSLECPNRTSAAQKSESEGLELSNVPKENHLISSENNDSSLCSLSSAFCTDLEEESKTLNMNDGLSLFPDAEEHDLPPLSMSEYVRGCQNLNNTSDCTKTFMHSPVDHPNNSHQNDVCFVTIDSFEPDSSDGEENVSIYEGVSVKSETGQNLRHISNTMCELQKDCSNGILSEMNQTCVQNSLPQGTTTTLSKHSTLDLYTPPWSLSASFVPEDDATSVGTVNLSDSQQNISKTGFMGKCSLGICSESNTGGAKTDLTNEPVVRPKIRKTYPSVSSGKDPLITDGNVKEAKSSRREKQELHANVQKSSTAEKVNTKEPDFVCEGAQRKVKEASKDILTPSDSKPLVDDTFWDDFEVYGLKIMDSSKDEESSECSDGEWSTCLPSYFSGDKDQSSSDESWETLPGKEEHDVQSNSSSLEEENSDFSDFQVEEQTSLEDGEIPWLQYSEDIESSTDEENEIGNHYLPPGFFILDGNNNLEDDSSMSEDLDVEWRLLDDFGEGIGVAQAMSYMDPQFLTYMALEERLAQAMETALAHLESLAVDVEQAHPPATKESIDCLPQIVLTDDHIIVGQEQCCAICCSEYIKDEILTELPCHHLFHKPCVALWLQKYVSVPS
uniref:RING-type E3 ubiquitin transferase n=1 Tax=Pyxicephalus adspersus TaxID=30357 RepID=A0AAV3AH42_PYXAD|nr:TPA: hypothetical protein GDO54_014289 [Pyxicephalus adspersus]